MRDIFTKINNVGKMHSKQTGRFPAMPSKGNQYIMVLVEVDGNCIDAEPIQNKSEGSIKKVYLILWTRLMELGTVQPKIHILDNKVSEAYKAEIKKNCTQELVPPGNHQQNHAGRSLQTFKNCFKAIIAGVDNNFPMKLWDRLLPQRVLTLNLLGQSNIAPTVSAYQYIHGAFNYNIDRNCDVLPIEYDL
jgi:hypothetical protein